MVCVCVNMYFVVFIGEVVFLVLNKNMNCVYLYDKDKQVWMFELDIFGKYLVFKFYYIDVFYVFRKCI